MEETDITVCPPEERSAAGTEAQTTEDRAAVTQDAPANEGAANEPGCEAAEAGAASGAEAVAVADATGAPESDNVDAAAEPAPADASGAEVVAVAGTSETPESSDGDAAAEPATADSSGAEVVAVADTSETPESSDVDEAAETAPADASGAEVVNSTAEAGSAVAETAPESADDEAVIEIVAEAMVVPVSGDLLPQLVEAAPDEAEAESAAIKAVIEGIVYITEEPVTVAQIANALQQPEAKIQEIIDEIIAEFDEPRHGLAVREIAGGYKMTTKPEHHEEIRNFVRSLKPPLKLSLAALETLATIAYKQPITAPEIMEIRGVQGTGVLKTLLDRKLIMTAGRKNVVGRPMLYKTTREFLVQFGLRDLSELPSLKEFEELKRLAFSDGDVVAAEPAQAPPEESAEQPAEPEDAETEAVEADAATPEQQDPEPQDVAQQEPEPVPAAEAAESESEDSEPENGQHD